MSTSLIIIVVRVEITCPMYLTIDEIFYPIPNRHVLLRPKRVKLFTKLFGKTENAGFHLFLLFPQGFLSFYQQILTF